MPNDDKQYLNNSCVTIKHDIIIWACFHVYPLQSLVSGLVSHTVHRKQTWVTYTSTTTIVSAVASQHSKMDLVTQTKAYLVLISCVVTEYKDKDHTESISLQQC